MEEKDFYYEKIHRFLADEMDASEKAAFQIEIENDNQLRIAVENERLLLAGIENRGENALRSAVASTHDSLRSEGFFRQITAEPQLTVSHKNTQFVMKNVLAIAAVFVALVAAFWFLKPQKLTPDEAFAKLYQPKIEATKDVLANLHSMGMAGAQDQNDSLKTAIQLLEDGKTDDAIALLKAIVAAHPDNETAQFYLGMAFLGKGLYARAIEIFTPISLKKDFALQPEAVWHLALCYLKTPDGKGEARRLFELLKENPKYRRDAEGAISLI